MKKLNVLEKIKEEIKMRKALKLISKIEKVQAKMIARIPDLAQAYGERDYENCLEFVGYQEQLKKLREEFYNLGL